MEDDEEAGPDLLERAFGPVSFLKFLVTCPPDHVELH